VQTPWQPKQVLCQDVVSTQVGVAPSGAGYYNRPRYIYPPTGQQKVKSVADSLQSIADEVSVCEKCPLHNSRVKAVPGEGPLGADIMFIGEAPGFHENQQGRPFVGAAGQYLDELLALIGLERGEVFIGNVVKCRPPGNRDPQPAEIEACRPYLERQIVLIDPKMIVTLGRYSMARYFPDAKISHIHGQPKRVGKRLIYPMYHPAAALHQPSLRAVVEEDMQKIPELIAQLDSWVDEQEPPPEQPQQLSLF
jgi:uracil-DNA glycosylase family 4